MRIGFRKNRVQSGFEDMFRQCENLFAANPGLVTEDHDGCADAVMGLVAPDQTCAYLLCYSSDGVNSDYALFPFGKYAGYGSFVDSGGEFHQQRPHGRITPDGARQILDTFVPCRIEKTPL